MMKNLIWLYIVNTALLFFPLCRQFIIIVRSPENDPDIKTKVVFFISSICLLIGMWACYYKVVEAAWIFFLIIIVISVWTYRHEGKK